MPNQGQYVRQSGATGQKRLAISFWNFGLLSMGPHGIFNDLEQRMAEAVERGFNCIRTEGGVGITHDAKGWPRGDWSSTQPSRAMIILPASCST